LSHKDSLFFTFFLSLRRALRILNSQTRFAVSSQISIFQNRTSLSRKFQNAPMDDLDYFDVDPWVENCVREMQNSLNEHQARARSRRLLEAFITTYSKLAWSNAESVGSHCENLQGLIEGARMQINNLKQAQEAQLEREKELENRNLEVQYLKQLVPEYQSRLRALEEEKNELTMQLQQAQQSNSNPRGFRAP
ncbi:hypothetical protein CFP56_027466, partial [Quercus suber]